MTRNFLNTLTMALAAPLLIAGLTLFSSEEELVNAMAWAATHLPALRRRNRASLLPDRFHQSINIERFTEIIEA